MSSKLEQFFGPVLRGPLASKVPSTGAWCGQTTIASGDASVTVSTAQINSGDVLLFTPVTDTRASSGAGRAFEVSSLRSGISFDVATADGIGVNAPVVVNWFTVRRS